MKIAKSIKKRNNSQAIEMKQINYECQTYTYVFTRGNRAVLSYV